MEKSSNIRNADMDFLADMGQGFCDQIKVADKFYKSNHLAWVYSLRLGYFVCQEFLILRDLKYTRHED
jgi:hypothetical protein